VSISRTAQERCGAVVLPEQRPEQLRALWALECLEAAGFWRAILCGQVGANRRIFEQQRVTSLCLN